jgi:hypothetical protein
MQAADRADFKALLTDALAFYRQDVSKFSLTVWWAACAPFDFEQVAKAFTAHATDAERGRFPPMPADIVRQLQGTQTDRSLLAWGKVYEAMQRVGAYTSVVFDDPAIHAVIEDLGGWVALCRSEADALPHTQRRFCEAHRAYARRPDLPYPPVLLGAHEADNRLAGKASAKPMLIGDPEAARRVMSGGVEASRVAIQALDAMPAMKRLETTA